MSFVVHHSPAAGSRDPRSPGLNATNLAGALLVGGCTLLTACGLFLSAADNVVAWLAGQVLLAAALLQWFILLHEAGHLTLFRNRSANIVCGHIAGFFAMIPFESWRRVHGLHHLWTGWQDLDPTTAPLVPRTLNSAERIAVDWAWKLWLPLFSVLYRLNNYWRIGQLTRRFRERRARVAMCANLLLLLGAYVAIAVLVGAVDLAAHVGPAIFLSLVVQDPLILSQHTHVPQNVSGGEPVSPVPPADQGRYTRSLRFPRWIAQGFLINFNAHELHHRYLSVPGYRLGRIAHQPANEVGWWTWLREAKRLPGSVFLFSNREQTGFRW